MKGTQSPAIRGSPGVFLGLSVLGEAPCKTGRYISLIYSIRNSRATKSENLAVSTKQTATNTVIIVLDDFRRM